MTRFSAIVTGFAAATFCFALLAYGHTQQNKPSNKNDSPPPENSARRTADPSQYVGAETCKTCHEDMYKNFEATPHFVTTLDTKKGPGWQGCEACHGPGKAHVEGGGDKSKIFTFKNVSAKESSDRCLGCHSHGEEHSNFARSAHLQNNVGYVDCHSPPCQGKSIFDEREAATTLLWLPPGDQAAIQPRVSSPCERGAGPVQYAGRCP